MRLARRRNSLIRLILAFSGALASACGSSGKTVDPTGLGGQSGAGAGGAAGGAGAAGGTAGAAGGAGGAGAGGTAGASGRAGASVDAGLDVSAARDAGADSSTLPTGTGCGVAGTLCWDFEEGQLPMGWSAYRNEFTTGSLLVDTTRPHRGTFALHAKDFTGGKEGSDGGPKHTMRYNLPAGFGPVLWGRAFIYMTPTAPMSHAGFFNARYPRPNAAVTGAAATDVTKLDWYEVATSGGNYVSIWHPPEPPGTPEAVQISATAGVSDRWACVEWLFDAQNGAAAEAADPRLWIDGVEITWPTMIVAPTGAARPVHEKAQSFTVLEAGIYLYQGLTTVTNWWIDDLAVGKQRIGCD